MKTLTVSLVFGSLVIVGCASSSQRPPQLARTCVASPVGDPSAQAARGNASASDERESFVHDPGAAIARGNAPSRDDAPLVVSSRDPEVARGGRSADCSLPRRID